MTIKQLQAFAWGLSIAVVVTAFIAWGQGYDWELSGLSTYQLFPLLGLLAFSLMWSHYAAAVLRLHTGAQPEALSRYFETTSLAVLVLILLHPGLVIWQIRQDGLGLPPGSLKAYAGSSFWAVQLGLIALLAFLAYELRRKFKTRSWWKYVSYMSDVAMFLILIHALQLGSHLQEGWFRTVWYFYGLSLAVMIPYMYYLKSRKTS